MLQGRPTYLIKEEAPRDNWLKFQPGVPVQLQGPGRFAYCLSLLALRAASKRPQPYSLLALRRIALDYAPPSPSRAPVAIDCLRLGAARFAFSRIAWWLPRHPPQKECSHCVSAHLLVLAYYSAHRASSFACVSRALHRSTYPFISLHHVACRHLLLGLCSRHGRRLVHSGPFLLGPGRQRRPPAFNGGCSTAKCVDDGRVGRSFWDTTRRRHRAVRL